MDTIRLGKVLTKEQFDKARRDAIHVAIAPLRAGQILQVGQKFKLNEKREAIALNDPNDDWIGIVDPFIHVLTTVWQGEYFYGLLKPGTITGLRHVWNHPAFDIDYRKIR